MLSAAQTAIIRETTGKFNPTRVSVFGSYARAEANETSDLDILIDFETPIHLLDLIGLEQELSELLGLKVDLVTVRSLHPLLKPYVEADLIKIV